MAPADLNKKLNRSFYITSAQKAARMLLGKIFVRIKEGSILSGMITEVEAYDGSVDEAAHTFIGKTKRNEVMFGEGGVLYVYFTYGMHFCCNVVTGKEGEGCAVLLRGIEPLEGIDEMAVNRYGRKTISEKEKINLTNGPAKITQAFAIDRSDNGKDLTGSEIFILDAETIPLKKISVTKRIGIKKSVDLPWRFYINGNSYVSKK